MDKRRYLKQVKRIQDSKGMGVMVSYYEKPTIDTKRMVKFNQAKERHMNFLSSVLWKLTGDQALFKKAMQFALFEIWQNLETIQGKQGKEELYQIVLSANAHAWDQSPAEADCPETRGEIPLPSRLFQRRAQLAQRVRWGISQLHPQETLAIVLRYMERQDYSTIAHRLGCHPLLVHFHLSKALDALKAKLKALPEPSFYLCDTRVA
jgi:DNA-directed RNA polymerase specialized sigma24 family protein